MSDNPNQGRWDHLLREIPSQSRKETVVATRIEQETLVVESQPEPSSEKIYSVSEVNRAIKQTLEGQFVDLWLQGEVSNFKAHTSGHFYFSLKDDKAQINAVMFKGYNTKLKFRPESGMEVLVRGKVTVYEPRGNYQIFAEHMEPVGAGALQKAFEQLKAKLQAEGLFEQQFKKPLPAFPQRVAVVTSPTGAAIQDILNVLGRRAKRVAVTVIPARVQGEGASQEVVRGIEAANRIGQYDVLIVGRGGGSIEDLWCFNEEIVARALFASKIPVISAVGHEIDYTIADFVADYRAPTPSAAAEVVAKSEQEIVEKLKFASRSLRLMIYSQISERKNLVMHMRRRLVDPAKFVEDCMLRVDDWSLRLQQSFERALKHRRLQVKVLRQSLVSPVQRLAHQRERFKNLNKNLRQCTEHHLLHQKRSLQQAMGLLHSLSPLRVVDRGFALVKQDGHFVPSLSQLKKGKVQVQMRDGQFTADITEIEKKEKP